MDAVAMAKPSQDRQRGFGATLPVRGDLAGSRRVSWVLAALVAVSSIVGIILGGNGFYDPYEASLAGLVGQDVASLVLGLPVLLISMRWTREGSTAGLLAWAGALFYFAYSYFFFIVGGFNALFPVYVAIAGTSLYGLLGLLVAIDPTAVRASFGAHTPYRPVAAFLIGTVGLFLFIWGGMTMSLIGSGEQPDPVLHLVVAIDGSVLLPALLLGGSLLWRRAAWGYALGGLLLVKATLTGLTLAFTTSLSGLWAGALAPMDSFLLLLFGPMAVIGAALSVPFFGNLARARWSAEQAVTPAAAGQP